MKLTEKQIKFASFMTKQIVEAISPVIKTYIDKSIKLSEQKILKEFKNASASTVSSKLNEESDEIKRSAMEMASGVFSSKPVQETTTYNGVGNLPVNVTPDPQVNSVVGDMLHSDNAKTISDPYAGLKNSLAETNAMGKSVQSVPVVEQNTPSNNGGEVTMNSILENADKVQSSVFDGTYENPGKKMMEDLKTKDYSRFLED